ncbi:clathrin-coated vesicle protein [Exidia glandulosa HHB12029]|uniref:Clathrin-coated vesicle protein n=1 Tax=Exidia glandulosa HHB12029 TaxID=1314781 RepID=A0A165N685_EXIGL|nr:clathrin-coated vesicle protein [Exidia glandulosa HHB12029]
MAGTDDLQLDEIKVNGENGEIYVLHWLANTEKALKDITADALKPAQSALEATLVKVATAAEPFALPGRSVRRLVGRCLVAMYSKGDTRSLFDTMQVFLKVASEPKPQENKDARVTALYCIGDIMAALGSQIMSFATDVALLCLRLAKASANTVLLRYNALVCLRKTLTTASRALTDSTTKDVSKQSRNYLSDKALPVQRAAAEVLIALYPSGDGNRAVSDVEAIVLLCTKSLDGADQQTRRSLARLVGHILASTQTERAEVAEPTKKGKKGDQNEDNDTPAPVGISTDGPKLILPAADMLSVLSTQYNKAAATRKTRIGIFDFYATLLLTLGSAWVEANYATIVRHFFTDIVSSQRSTSSRYEILCVRKLVGLLLRELIGLRMLSEQGQIGAVRELSLSYVKKWPPVMHGQLAPTPLVLTIALREIAGLLQQLGNAPPPVQDALADPLLEVLSHPTHSVRVSAAWALRAFCHSAPRRLAKSILTVLEALQNNITALTSPAAPSDIERRTLGHAYGLAALFSIIPEKPLYVSYDLSAKVLDVAIQLLKRSGEHDIKIAGVEVEVAWTCISSLMCLGPNFVRAHLPQLMVLWRNALPKPTSKDTTPNSGRSDAEWGFLLHVRECALGAIFCFLQNNAALITLDVARRVSSLLNNALLFANAWVAQSSDDAATQNVPTTQAADVPLNVREAMLRRRIYQCYSALGFSSLTLSAVETLLQSAVTLFASADSYMGSTMQAAIATSSGNFTSVWLAADSYGFGVTKLASAADSTIAPAADASPSDAGERLNRDTIEAAIDSMITTPVIGSLEHDTSVLWKSSRQATSCPEPAPPATAVVDAAIELFSQLLPLQDPSLCSKTVSQLVDGCRSPKLERNVGRKTAVFVNATTAVMLALRVASAGPQRQARETFGSAHISSALTELLKGAIIDGDPVLRNAGSEALGRLAGLAGTSYLTSQITALVDQVVNNRDPNCRAGCALTFGAIYTHVGVLAAGPLLKTTVNVLMSLGNDPHPLVHFWALTALGQVINAASLSYAPFINSTIGMLVKLYSLDSHEPAGGSINNANLAGDLPTYQVICRIIDAVIGVTGPELQDSSSKRDLILDLVVQFLHETDAGIGVEAIRCIEHFLIFAPDRVDIPDLIQRLRANLSSPRRPLKVASINALYRLVQRDALLMSRVGGDKLVEDLFGMLDDDSTIDGVRNVITSWLSQTAAQNPSAWIDLCQRIMSRTTASQQAVNATAAGGLQDDEGESLGVVASGGGGAERQTSRWRTQLFALQCLHDICRITVAAGVREHVDIPFAKRRGLPTSRLLVSRVPDLIKMAFTASAAHVPDIRLEGLVVLRDVIEIFAKSPDPDYEDALFLEQHQAPITAALTPAFGQDSTPEVLASGVQVCAVFVGCGIVKDVSRMGRILKLLTSALEQSKGFGTLSIGDMGHLSPNASVMLRISTLTAWAELQIASPAQSYLEDVLKPHRATLSTLWIASLRDYASIRVDSEVSQDPSSAAMDSSYFGLGREVLLPYYAKSWPRILRAVSNSMRAQDPTILAAMDGLEAPNTDNLPKTDSRGLREDPTAFFFPVFGLVFEALSSQSSEASSSQESTEMTVTALEALKSLVRPEYSGSAVLDQAIFDELIGLCYRLALTEPALVQRHLVETISSLAVSQGDRLLRGKANGHTPDAFPVDAPLSDCLRICSFVLRHAVPTSRSVQAAKLGNSLPERITMLNAAFTAFARISALFGPSRREDLRGVGVTLYSAFLKDELSEVDLVGPTLPSLKALLEVPADATVTADNSAYSRVIHGLLSTCLLNIEEMRGREGPIPNTKTKNNLLASVIILTSVPVGVKLSQVALEQCCYLISQRLTEVTEVSPSLSLTAGHCAKTLITGATAGSPTLQYCVKFLVPGMITYIARVSSLANDSTGPTPDVHIKATEEALKAFTAFYNSVPESKRTLALAILLPVEVMLLDPSKAPLSHLHVNAVAQLLSFATTTPVAFKEAAAKLDPVVREKLETSVRQAIGGGSAAAPSQSAKPQISLRSF